MPGTQLGPYQIDRELGSGGMGRVYAANGPDGVVALKVVHPHLLETPGFFKRFMREAQLGQSIRHENVVRTLDCDQEFAGGKPQCFLVMEYVEGQTLSDLLRELERVPEELCRHVAREILKGLAAVHEAGVVHRDLKPDNVLITPEHVVKVMDLGVAQVADEALRLSRTGAFVGSVEYAAPEQFKGGDVDGRTDLHALGVLLYELSSGQHPYRGGGFHEVMTRVCDAAPRRLGELHPQLSAFFEEVVHTLLVKDPRGRFASAAQLLDVLEEGESSAWWQERSRALQASTKRPIRRIRVPRETAVYGREDELERLRGLYAAAKAGDGQVVLIEGEAGIGKSRLVDELVGRLQADGEDLHFLFGSYPPGGAATAAGGFSSAFREQFGESGSAAYLPENQLLVPAFDALLRGEGAAAGAHALTPESLRTCFVRATQELAAERVTVLLIDDLHFAPEEGRALFLALALALPGHRVLLIGSTRPGVSQEWRAGLTRLPHVSQLPLQRLGPKDLVRLLADSLHSQQLAEDLGGKIAVKSDGNPFFAFEIIRGLREGQFLTQKEDGTWATTRVIDEIQVPSSVLDLVNARVSGLSQEERDVLDVAACSGYQFDPALISEVTGLGRIPLLKMLAQVERAHRLIRASGRSFVFDHHQVQEALYGSLPEMLREEYHAALADALESRAKAATTDPNELPGALCVELCEHFFLGARGESALRYLDAALSHLETGYLNDAAIRLADRALSVPGLVEGAARCRVLLRKSARCELLGRRDALRASLDEALVLADASGDAVLRASSRRTLGRHLSFVGRTADAEAMLVEARDLARAAGHTREEAAATGSLGIVMNQLSRFAEAEVLQERYLALARELGDRGWEAGALGNLGLIHRALGRHDDARTHFLRQLELSHEAGDPRSQIHANGNVASVLASGGNFTGAQAHFEAGLAIAREIGDRRLEALVTGNLGMISVLAGRLAEAETRLERSLALALEIGERELEGFALGHLGNVAAQLGRPADSRTHHERYLEIARVTRNRREEGYALYGLAAAVDNLGDTATARRWAEEALRVRREIRYGDGIVASLLQVAGLCAGTGETDAARAAIDEFLAHPLSQVEPASFARGLALSGALSGGDASAAVAALEEAGDAASDADAAGICLVVWQATRDRAHLEAAKRHLDAMLARSPAQARDAIRTNVRVNREILAAWREEFGEDEGPRGTESATRVGPGRG